MDIVSVLCYWFEQKLFAYFQGWEFAHLFSKRIARFLPKKEQMSDSLKKNEQFTHSLIFGELPERFAHDRSFPLSNVSELLMVANFW